ncbi:MAG: hypothetical protein II002_04020 [Bacteroidales bacterium]|nr:hypothetical protein [Bacteroidales bacterium]
MKNPRLTILALLLVCGTACQQKEILPEETPVPEPEKKVVITASFAQADTRISYTEDPETHKLHQDWEVGDMLFGFDDNSQALTLEVTAVDGETGVATLDVADGSLPESGAIHMLYTGDREVSPTEDLFEQPYLFFENGLPVSVNIAFQPAATGTTVPAIATADATVSGTDLHLVFENQTAVLGIKGFHGLPAGSTVVSFFVEGVNNYASISLENGKLCLTPADNPNLQGAVFVEKDGGWTADEMGAVNETFYVAVFPNSQAADIQLSAYDLSNGYYVNQLGSKSIAAGKYYYMNNKELSAPVAYVTTFYETSPFFSFDDALAAANASQEDCILWLAKDCSPAAPVSITNTQASMTLDLNGHKLTLGDYGIKMTAEEVDFTICDNGETKGEILENVDETDLLRVEAGSLTVNGVALRSTCNNPILRQLGGDIAFFDATLTHEHSGTLGIRCIDGYLSFENTVVEHKNSDGNVLLYVYNGTPEIFIGGKTSFIHAGKANLINVANTVPQNSLCITIDDAYFWHNSSSNNNSMIYSANAGNVNLVSAHFNRSNSYARNAQCSLSGNQSVVKIYPPVTVNDKIYNYRTLKSSIPAYDNTKEAYISYAVGEGKRMYPAQFNITYKPSTGTWAFRNQASGYSTDYDPDLISLFTWGYGAWSVIPDGTDYLTSLQEGQTLSPEQDWSVAMNAGPCRVPTREEWEYLLNERQASTVNGVENARFLKCKYYQSYGLLLFPDEFSWPAAAGDPPDVTAINKADNQYTTAITNAGVIALTRAGCVFLQADGYRNGNTVNRHPGAGIQASGNYWSSTARGYSYESYFLSFYQTNMYASSYSGSQNTGHAVRLFFE